jgi:hypothetical protein
MLPSARAASEPLSFQHPPDRLNTQVARVTLLYPALSIDGRKVLDSPPKEAAGSLEYRERPLNSHG